MLEFQSVPISIEGGLDTKTDEKLVLPGKLTLLENGVRTVGKRISKRNGYERLASPVSNPQGLAAFGNELALFAANTVYSYSGQLDALVSKGAAYSVGVSSKSVARNSAGQTSPDLAILNGVSVYAWTDSRGGVRATVVDQSTDSAFQSDVSLSSTGTSPRMVTVAGFIFVVYAEGASLKARRLSPLSPASFDAAVTIGSDLNSSAPHFDVATHGLKAVIAYHSGTNIKVKYLTQDGVVGSPTIGLPNPLTLSEDAANSLCALVEPTSLTTYVFYHNGSAGLKVVGVAQDFTTALSPTVIDATTSPVVPRLTAILNSQASIQLYYEVSASSASNHLVKSVAITSAGAQGAISTLKRGVGLASRAFQVSGTKYALCAFDSTLQATYFLCDSSGNIVAKILSTKGGGLPASNALPSVVLESATFASVPTLVKTKFVSEGNTTFTQTGVSKSEIDFSPAAPFITKKLGDNLHLSGGFLAMYDGAGVVEHGFHLFPEGVSASPASSGGSLGDGTYQYFVVYQWVDNRGQMHRSAPSVGTQAAVSGGAGSGSVTLTIPTLRLTAKSGARANVTLEVYRTKANQTVAYKVTSTTSPLFNDPTLDTVSFVDTAADSSIGANEILYTTGSVVENIAAPACSFVESYKNRLMLLPSEDLLSIWYSKTHFEGEAVAFNDSFVQRVNPLGGDTRAFKFMDEKLLIFKESLIFAMAGDGPTDTGDQDNFSEPEMVSSDVGIKDVASLVLTPAGVMFKSSKGIYLINRSLEVSYIGADVEAYNSQSVTSAELLSEKNQVRFLTSDGVSLVYDYFYNQWSTFTNHAGIDAEIWNGTYVYLRNDGSLYREKASYFKDYTLEFHLRVGTAWIKLAGVQGFQRVRRAMILGNYMSPHILRVQVGYDYDPTYPGVYLFNTSGVFDSNTYGSDALYGQASVYGGASDNTYQFELRLSRQKCEAIRFLFEDVTTTTPGEGYSLSDLSLEVGMKRGLNKLKAANKVG